VILLNSSNDDESIKFLVFGGLRQILADEVCSISKNTSFIFETQLSNFKSSTFTPHKFGDKTEFLPIADFFYDNEYIDLSPNIITDSFLENVCQSKR
jgi:hypothetical protein